MRRRGYVAILLEVVGLILFSIFGGAVELMKGNIYSILAYTGLLLILTGTMLWEKYVVPKRE